MMKRVLFLLLMLFPLLLMAKPQSPLKVVVESDEQPVAGTVLFFRVTAISRVDLSAATLTLTLPAGVELLQGQMQQTLTMKAGRAQMFEFRVYLPVALTGQIEVGLATPENTGFYMTARGGLRLGEEDGGSTFSRSLNSSPGVQKNESNGQRTREYMLR